MSSITCETVGESRVIVTAGSKKKPIYYEADLTTMEQLGPVYYSKNPQSPFYVPPQKRAMLRRYIRFLTPENIQKYIVDFVRDLKPCSLRRVYYTCTNYCRKFPERTTYSIWRTDLMTGTPVKVTVVLWEEYVRHLKAEPRLINDCFQRRTKNSTNAPSKLQDIVLCKIGPGLYRATASVQIVFLHMIDSIQLLDQIPRWLPLIDADHRATTARRIAERAECEARNQPYRRRALNPVKLVSGNAPLNSFSE